MKDGYVGGKERNKTCGRKVSTSFSLNGKLWHFKKPLRLPESKASWTRKALKQLFSKICQFPHLFIPQAIPKPFKLREHFFKKRGFQMYPFLLPHPTWLPSSSTTSTTSMWMKKGPEHSLKKGRRPNVRLAKIMSFAQTTLIFCSTWLVVNTRGHRHRPGVYARAMPRYPSSAIKQSSIEGRDG